MMRRAREIGREPRPEEIAEKMEIPIDKIRQLIRVARDPISLEAPVGDDESSKLGDFIEDKGEASPAEAVIEMDLSQAGTNESAGYTVAFVSMPD